MPAHPPTPRRTQLLQARAYGLRKQPTVSEALLWSALRGRQLGVSFRRQCVLGGFIVDFLAPEVRLVVEVDGGYHAERRRADERRDRALARLGYRVLRLDAKLVVGDLQVALCRITDVLCELGK